MAPVYLDNAASTRIDDAVLALMTEVMRTAWGNPSSQHPQGAAARDHIATARRRLLTPTGRRLETDGMAFLGPRLQLQIGRRARVRLGRFVWIGHGTKIRCHEGRVEIGAKSVLGQDCTISAYRSIRIGEQCVIADRAMFIAHPFIIAAIANATFLIERPCYDLTRGMLQECDRTLKERLRCSAAHHTRDGCRIDAE